MAFLIGFLVAFLLAGVFLFDIDLGIVMELDFKLLFEVSYS